ncbi:MAG TPA: winged helix-turn-helix transcriptional regulator [Solirubrobacterales bacterium]|nr:winged helix-turn-helix transcriptional regulator [Solirubrobacterales bacterium]
MALAEPSDAGVIGDSASASSLLQLLGTGAAGPILLALGRGPLRTNELATQVAGYGPRTVYRYLHRLVDLRAVERDERPGVPSNVVYALTDPCGTELFGLIDLYTKMALGAERNVPHAWRSLKLLGDLRTFGMFEELNDAPCTATELASLDHELSFHQVRRRIDIYLVDEVICEARDRSRQRRYELTRESRQAMALVVGLGGWRERHVDPVGMPGLTRAETAGLIRAVLPLVVLPEHGGESFNLIVVCADSDDADGRQAVRIEVDVTGRLVNSSVPMRPADAWGQGEVKSWLEALRRGASDGIRVGAGDRPLINASLRGIFEALWSRPTTEAF